MQEDKEQVFDAADSLMLGLAAMTGMVGDMTANREMLAAAAASGFSTATDLADWLVRALGLPFREAHHVTGTLVAMAEGKGCDLPDLSLAEMNRVASRHHARGLLGPRRRQLRPQSHLLWRHRAGSGPRPDRPLGARPWADLSFPDRSVGGPAMKALLLPLLLALAACSQPMLVTNLTFGGDGVEVKPAPCPGKLGGATVTVDP